VIALGKTDKPVLRDGIDNVSCPTGNMCMVDNAHGQVAVGTR
jgi:hypothetical protein